MCKSQMAPRIISRFGGVRAMERRTTFKRSTISYWNVSGFIPSQHLCDVLRAGQELDPPLRPEEFFDDIGAAR